MTLSLSGNFQETCLADVLEVLRLQKATGTLVCRCSGTEKSVHVQQGKIIFAASTDPQDRLGEILVKSGKLRQDHLDAVLQLHRKNAGLKKIGALLVENGFVSPKDLFNGLKLQVKGIIHGLFLRDDGEYRFEERLPSDVIPLQLNMEELVQEVIQQMKKGA
jgi:hypothetical protein